ncbi:MAG: exodeoxyribonuclease V subunit gamma [Bacteroidetes bacterium]|nr:exodeoxyribonuclease V subunit gamma [Bacteroidota bacterium]
MHPGLHIVQSNRLEKLAEQFAAAIAVHPLPAPLAPEIVVVHDRTVGEWLDLLLARTHGVSANMQYRSPGQFIWDLYRAADPSLPPRSPYDAEILQWHILHILEDGAFVKRHLPLLNYLSRGDSLRRYDLAVRLAGLFNRYLVYRMDWLEHWEAGSTKNLGPDEAWQADLWRRITSSNSAPHRARLFRTYLQMVEKGIPGLPERVSVFGISSLSPAYVDILRALGTRTSVLVYVLNPCREKWDDIADERLRVRTDLEYSAELMHVDVPHALLGSLGKQGRDFIRFVVEAEGEGSGATSFFEDPGKNTLLHALQSGILHLSEESVQARENDDSIEIHSCHTRMREVEVLRDRFLAMLDQDRTLLPSDILVLAPDINAYAPYIEAVFPRRVHGEQSTRPAQPLLPFDITDRVSGQIDIVVDAWIRLLDLPSSRFDADLVLDLLRIDPLREAFGIGVGELDTLGQWVEESGIRWGLDGEQKAEWGLPRSDQFTWSWGLDRMVLGAGMPRALAGDAPPIFHGLLPFDSIEGQQVDLLDRLTGFVGTLREWLEDLRRQRPMIEWERVLSGWLDRFIPPAKEYLENREEIRDVIADAVAASEEGGYDQSVESGIIRSLFTALQSETAPWMRFLGGGITFCSMKPMRPLPFRVVAMLGMADGEFPRNVKPPSFDLMQTYYRHGDRSARLDDRYLFLELLLSARDRLSISYIGEDVKTGKVRPMSPVVAELLEFLAGVGFHRPGTDPRETVDAAMSALHISHPLQAFSPRYFDGQNPRLFSYSREACELSKGIGTGNAAVHAVFTDPLPEPGPEFKKVRLDDLCRFYANPARALFEKRLGVRFREEEDSVETQEPLTVGKAETRAIYKALHEDLRKGVSADQDLLELLLADGRLPVGVAGSFGMKRILEEAQPYIAAYRELLATDRLPPLAEEIPLDTWTLEVYQNDVTSLGLYFVKAGRVRDADIVSFWVRWLVTSLLHPNREAGGLMGTLLGVDGLREFRQAEQPMALLQQLLLWYEEGLKRPLHFFPRMALEFAQKIEDEDAATVLEGLRNDWDRPNPFAGYVESRDEYFSRAFSSGAEAIDQEFETLARAIAVRLREKKTETLFGKKKK